MARWKPTRSHAGQTGGDLGAPRQTHEQLHRRERDVEEEADDEVGSLVAQHLGHELQVVVVDPHDRPVWCDLGEGVGEALVDALVGVPVLAVVGRVAQGVVVQRPQCVVGEPLVVVLDLVGAHQHGLQVHAVERERLGNVVGLAGPADPCPAARSQQWEQGPHQTAGAGDPAVRRAGDRQAVGGDDDGASGDGEALLAGLHHRQLGRVLRPVVAAHLVQLAAWMRRRSRGTRRRGSLAVARPAGLRSLRSLMPGPVPARGRPRDRRTTRCRRRAVAGRQAPPAATRPRRRESSRRDARSGSPPPRGTRRA